MPLDIDEFLDRLNRKGSLNPVSKATKTAYRNTLEQFERFLGGRQLTQELAQEWFTAPDCWPGNMGYRRPLRPQEAGQHAAI